MKTQICHKCANEKSFGYVYDVIIDNVRNPSNTMFICCGCRIMINYFGASFPDPSYSFKKKTL